MPGAIRLFVSSSPELQMEREAIGQIVATLPLLHGWQIDHTPLPGEAAADDLARVAACDLYVAVLGHDFAAPMGAELRQALLVGRQPLAYHRRCMGSPSSQDAVRRSDVEWRTFNSLDAFRARVRRDLLQALIRQASTLGLVLGELERLLASAEEEVERLEVAHAEGRRHGEAGRSGVILGREVWEEGS